MVFPPAAEESSSFQSDGHCWKKNESFPTPYVRFQFQLPVRSLWELPHFLKLFLFVYFIQSHNFNKLVSWLESLEFRAEKQMVEPSAFWARGRKNRIRVFMFVCLIHTRLLPYLWNNSIFFILFSFLLSRLTAMKRLTVRNKLFRM